MKYKIEKINEGENQIEYKVSFLSPEDYRRALYSAYLKNRLEFVDDLTERPSFESILYDEFSDGGERLDNAVITAHYPEMAKQIEEEFDLVVPDLYVSKIEYEKDEESGTQIPAAIITELRLPPITYSDYRMFMPEKMEDGKSEIEIQVEVVRALSNLREQNVRLVPNEGEVGVESLVNATILREKDEEEVETIDFGGNSPNGSALGVAEFGLIGSKPEQIVKPNELANMYFQQLYGPDEYLIRVNQVYDKEYPEVDDDFAAEVSEFDTLEELQNNIKETIVEGEKGVEDSDYFFEVINKIIGANEITLEEHLNGIIPGLEDAATTQLMTSMIPDVFQDVIHTTKSEVGGTLLNKIAINLAKTIEELEKDLLDSKDYEIIEKNLKDSLDEVSYTELNEEDQERIANNQKDILTAQRIIGKIVRGESKENAPETGGE